MRSASSAAPPLAEGRLRTLRADPDETAHTAPAIAEEELRTLRTDPDNAVTAAHTDTRIHGFFL